MDADVRREPDLADGASARWHVACDGASASALACCVAQSAMLAISQRPATCRPAAYPVRMLRCGLQGESSTGEMHDDVVLWLTPLGELAGESAAPAGRAHPSNHTSAPGAHSGHTSPTPKLSFFAAVHVQTRITIR